MTDPLFQNVLDDWWYAHYKKPPFTIIETDAMDTCLKMVQEGLGGSAGHHGLPFGHLPPGGHCSYGTGNHWEASHGPAADPTPFRSFDRVLGGEPRGHGVRHGGSHHYRLAAHAGADAPDGRDASYVKKDCEEMNCTFLHSPFLSAVNSRQSAAVDSWPLTGTALAPPPNTSPS